jgi:hypothetical protein
MERFLLLWDELDDIVGTSRYYVKNTAMAIWTSVRPDKRGLNFDYGARSLPAP